MSKPVIGVLNVSDRASAGVYADEPGQACVALLREWLVTEFEVDYRVVPDEIDVIAGELTAAGGRRRLLPDRHHRWYRTCTAGCHARGHAAGGATRDAGFR